MNDDGKFSKKELIYKGKCRQPFEEDELIDDTTANVEEQVTFTDGCECESTNMAVFKVDKIEPDETKKVQFVDDVQMNRAEVAGTLTINETPFATFDAASNKLIIG